MSKSERSLFTVLLALKKGASERSFPKPPLRRWRDSFRQGASKAKQLSPSKGRPARFELTSSTSFDSSTTDFPADSVSNDEDACSKSVMSPFYNEIESPGSPRSLLEQEDFLQKQEESTLSKARMEEYDSTLTPVQTVNAKVNLNQRSRKSLAPIQPKSKVDVRFPVGNAKLLKESNPHETNPKHTDSTPFSSRVVTGLPDQKQVLMSHSKRPSNPDVSHAQSSHKGIKGGVVDRKFQSQTHRAHVVVEAGALLARPVKSPDKGKAALLGQPHINRRTIKTLQARLQKTESSLKKALQEKRRGTDNTEALVKAMMCPKAELQEKLGDSDKFEEVVKEKMRAKIALREKLHDDNNFEAVVEEAMSRKIAFQEKRREKRHDNNNFEVVVEGAMSRKIALQEKRRDYDRFEAAVEEISLYERQAICLTKALVRVRQLVNSLTKRIYDNQKSKEVDQVLFMVSLIAVLFLIPSYLQSWMNKVSYGIEVEAPHERLDPITFQRVGIEFDKFPLGQGSALGLSIDAITKV